MKPSAPVMNTRFGIARGVAGSGTTGKRSPRRGHLVDADDDRMVAVVRRRGRLGSADSWVELHYGIAYTVTEGLARRGRVFTTPHEVLEAVGLRGAHEPEPAR
jgi:hypothetical protein